MLIERNAIAVGEVIAGSIQENSWFNVQAWGGADGFPEIADPDLNCLAVEDSPPSLDVVVNSGGLFLDEIAYRVPSSQNVTFTDVSATRYDIIQYTPSLAEPFNRKAGTSTPGATTADSGSLIVAEIHLTSGITTIPDANITDKRVLV